MGFLGFEDYGGPFRGSMPGDGLDVAEHNEKKGERDGLQRTSGLGAYGFGMGFRRLLRMASVAPTIPTSPAMIKP